MTIEVTESGPSEAGTGLRVAVPLYRAETVSTTAHVGAAEEAKGGCRDLGDATKSTVHVTSRSGAWRRG